MSVHARLNFTGEYFVPGKSGERIEADHMARYRFAAGHVRGFSVLDIACGVGYAASVLLEAGATSYLGVDIRPELVQHARDIYGTEEATFEVGDVCQISPGSRIWSHRSCDRDYRARERISKGVESTYSNAFSRDGFSMNLKQRIALQSSEEEYPSDRPGMTLDCTHQELTIGAHRRTCVGEL